METAAVNILVVDDDKVYRLLLSENLEKQGYIVHKAESGERALEMLRTLDIDLVLLDLLMPGIDGYEVLCQIKNNPEWHHIAVIIISAQEDMDSLVRCIEAGAVDYLTKPFEPVLLRARIRASLAARQMRDLVEAHNKELFDVTARLQTIIEGASIGITVMDTNGMLVEANPAFQNMVQFSAVDLIGRNFTELTHPDDVELNLSLFHSLLNGEIDNFKMEKRYRRKDGKWVWGNLTAAVVKDAAGVPRYSISMIEDITGRKQAEEGARYQSFYDALTGLFNRTYFEEELNRLSNSRFFPVSIVAVDVDGLRWINETMGTVAGDEVLRRTAQILKDTFRSEDTIARVGEDEFNIILPNVDEKVAEKVVSRVRSRLASENQEKSDPLIYISMGVATGEAGLSLVEVRQKATESLLEEKKSKDAE
jgi:diguanylate cyclase (GGDEF)-like protein/PAS domain S-box-containing protein